MSEKPSTYTIETEDCTPSHCTATRTSVKKHLGDGMFEELVLDDDDDDAVFTYSHGGGKGEIKIPQSVLFSLPEMLAILNAERTDLFGESRIYKHAPIATLFKRSGNE